ncbi:MAG: cellulase family glycosylhydrolase [Rhodoferax sp.]|uniref:glycoside hydrolase family 5 protein n=1 Tax=Rhodoferax sp. TaxID=50421 RepID=UPI0026352E74|nr:cellulase family glycosylhydrolase [Rhodoferax sp.]MDD5332952.1 cellulase family glycosylhydrolase [Rhodoferax sp.]
MNRSCWRIAIRLCLTTLTLITFLPAVAYEITANDFRNSRFRGFHIEDVSSQRSSADLDALASTGANMVRISVFLKRCNECVSYDLPQTDLNNLDALIHALAARSIYAFVVLRPMGDERGPLWTSSLLQKSFIMQWKLLAVRYRNLQSVAGFDLLNEPVPPGRTYEDRQSMWLAYAETLGKEIRSVDPRRVLIVESAPDATTSSFNNMKTLPIDNVVYSFHSYSPFALTHQGVLKDLSKPLTYGTTPAMNVNRGELYKLLSIVDLFATKNNVPILVGEFSIARWAPQGSAPRYISDSVDYFEAKGWSWMYHDFRGWPGWDSEIDSESPAITKRSPHAPVMTILRTKMRNSSK